jgi:hypothetical protein
MQGMEPEAASVFGLYATFEGRSSTARSNQVADDANENRCRSENIYNRIRLLPEIEIQAINPSTS